MVGMSGCGVGRCCDATLAHLELVISGCDLGEQRGKQSDKISRRIGMYIHWTTR